MHRLAPLSQVRKHGTRETATDDRSLTCELHETQEQKLDAGTGCAYVLGESDKMRHRIAAVYYKLLGYPWQ